MTIKTNVQGEGKESTGKLLCVEYSYCIITICHTTETQHGKKQLLH